MPKEGFSPEEQLAVYTTGYRLRLAHILVDDYEVTARYLGKNIQAAVRDYIETVPSGSFDVAVFSSQFADWLQEQDIDDFAKELAHLEQLVFECFNLQESENLTANDLKNIAPDSFAAQKFALNSTAILASFEHDVHAYMNAFYEGGEAQAQKKKTHIIIFVRSTKVYRAELAEVECAMLQMLANNMSFGEAAEKLASGSNMAESELTAQIQTWFTRWLREGFLRSV